MPWSGAPCAGEDNLWVTKLFKCAFLKKAFASPPSPHNSSRK